MRGEPNAHMHDNISMHILIDHEKITSKMFKNHNFFFLTTDDFAEDLKREN